MVASSSQQPVSGFGSSISSLASQSSGFLIATLIAILVLDYFDGVMARRTKKNDEHIDTACDRVSELIIFLTAPIVLPLVVLNIFASIYRFTHKLPIVMPLRQIYLVVLLVAPYLWPALR